MPKRGHGDLEKFFTRSVVPAKQNLPHPDGDPEIKCPQKENLLEASKQL